MPDETVTPTETVAAKPAGETPAPEEQFDKDRAMALIEKLRAELKETKSRAKRADDLEAKLKQEDEAKLSEMEKLTKRLAETEAKLTAKERAEARRVVADKLGLPSALADRLQGETPEELEADAKKLLEVIPKKVPTINPTNPGGAEKGETQEQARARIYGQTTSIFDPEFGRKHGGGVATLKGE